MFTIYKQKPVGTRFVKMVSKTFRMGNLVGIGVYQNFTKFIQVYWESLEGGKIVGEGKDKGKGTPYLTLEVPLLSREYSPRKPTVRSFYPPLSISAPF